MAETKVTYEIESKIERIENHLKLLKQSVEEGDLRQREQEKNIQIILHAVTDNTFNANSGIISRLKNLEKTVERHSTYLQVIGTLIVVSGALAAFFKFVIHA